MLRELQLNLVNAINSGDNTSTLPIDSKPGFTQDELVGIYRESSAQGLINTLKNIFSTCLEIVQEPFFEELCAKYIELRPSSSPDINDYGNNFPEFIARFKPAKKWPYLSEMAQLDRLCHQVSRAPVLSVQLDFSLIGQALENDHDILFALLPSIDLLETSYPLYQLWQMYQPNYQGAKKFIFSGKKREYLIIYRQDSNLCLYKVDKSFWLVVSEMKQGQSLKNIIAKAEQKGVNIDLSAILPTILQEKWVSCFQLV
jgi:hypothetical protein